MKILIKNCTLVSMDANRPNYEKNKDVLIEDTCITKIGENIIEENIDKIIDAKENVLMPGLINAHCHIAMSLFRETVDGYNLQDWLIKKIWPIEDNLTPEDIYKSSCLSFLEMIETGTTFVNDMYFMEDETIKAAKEMGIRLETTRSLMDMGKNKDGQERLLEIKRLIKDYKNEELITINAGLHGLYTSSKEYAIQCMQFAKENNIPLHMHFCENTREVEDIQNNYQEMPIEFLTKYLPNNRTILAHCVKLTDEDINKLKKINADISIATCPVSNLKLGCGIAKVSKMLEEGLNVCIGTDGQGSGCSLDMFEQMKFTALLQKGINEKPELMPAYEILKMATINGATALGLDQKVGSIEVGKKADLILIDMHNTLTTPINDIISELVYNIKGHNVLTTIINGKILMENRKILTVGKDKLLSDF